jgi:hypothetical protein
MTKKELWLRIKGYHFEHIVPPNMWNKITEMFGGVDASTKAFADKISRKHNCSTSYAIKAVNEYKKFLYLAVISDFHVTPSQAIDKVWHEHILFTQAYGIFCKDIIEYNLNHHPELIPLDHAQYLSTIELYIQEFGKLPPANIWDVTKYDKEKVMENVQKAREKKVSENLYYSNNSYSSDVALYSSFDNSDPGSVDSYPEFGGFDGGNGEGGGASGDWDDSSDGSDSSDGGSDGGGDGGGCGGGCGGGGD